MSDKKRRAYLLAGLVLLIAANLYVYLSEDGLEGGSFWSSDFDLARSPRLELILKDLEGVRRISFREGRNRAPSQETGGRNPFVFGKDRRIEEERLRKMRELEQARQEMERAIVQEAAQPIEEKTRFVGKVVGIMKDSTDEGLMVSVTWNQEIYILKPGDAVGGFVLVDVAGNHVLFKDQKTGEEVKIDLEKD